MFTSTKIKSFSSAKDSVPRYLKSRVVYKFSCAGCNSCYVGETTRYLDTRIEEHLKKGKKSAEYKHIHENVNCFDKCTKQCFPILDTAPTMYQRKIKEGMYIGSENPDINRPKSCLELHIVKTLLFR